MAVTHLKKEKIENKLKSKTTNGQSQHSMS